MKPTAPLRNKFQRVCHNTVRWLISFSLDQCKRSEFPPVSVLGTLALVSCASQELQTTFLFPRADVTGKYASQWTIADLREVRDLVRKYPEIRKPLDHVEAYAPDKAHVQSGSPWLDPNRVNTDFEVRKVNGHWVILKGSINTGHVIITS